MGGTKSFIDISAKPPREDLEMRTHAVHVTTDTAPLALIPWPDTMAPNRLIPVQLCAVTMEPLPSLSIHPSTIYLWTRLPDSLPEPPTSKPPWGFAYSGSYTSPVLPPPPPPLTLPL